MKQFRKHFSRDAGDNVRRLLLRVRALCSQFILREGIDMYVFNLLKKVSVIDPYAFAGCWQICPKHPLASAMAIGRAGSENSHISIIVCIYTNSRAGFDT